MSDPAGSLRVLHESVVREEEIDALGHMNVRHYAERALASTDRLLAELAVELGGWHASTPLVHELPRLYTRYHREQHTGAPLVVRGGPVAVDGERLRIFHELRNPDRDELAACFVHDVAFRAPGEALPLEIPEAVQKELAALCTKLPAEGVSRSLDLDRGPVPLTLREAIDGGLAFRLPRTIEDDVCDGEGRVGPIMRPFLMWGGDPIPPARPNEGPPLFDLPDGGRMGWASLEARSVMVEQPVRGMRVQSFAATVELARKTSLRRYWVFDLETERLLLANEVVELALHIDERRAMDIPDSFRQEMQARLRTDLR